MKGGPQVARVVAAALFATFLAYQVPALAADGAGTPTLVDKKGESRPFPDNPALVEDKEWLGIQYPNVAGFKPRLGVVLSDEKIAARGEYSGEWARLMSEMYGQPAQGTNPFNHIEDMVRQALGATHRFTMVERTTATEDVLGEQDFGASGRVEKKTAARVGKMKGADYTVKATIIELNPEKDSKDIRAAAGVLGHGALGVGSVGISGKVAFCRLNVRVINSESGEIVQDLTADGTAKSSGFGIGGGVISRLGGSAIGGAGGGVKNKKLAPLSDAMQACANKIAYYTASTFENLPWQGAVASVTGDKIMINAGTNVGLKEGLVLKILAKGSEVTDPDTGESLGFETSEIGSARIVSVQEKFATCAIVEGGKGVKKGDLVRMEKAK